MASKIVNVFEYIKFYYQKIVVEDYLPLAVVGFHIGLLNWALLYFIWTPWLLLFKPYIGFWFLLPLCWSYYDRKTPKTGGRRSKWFCNMKIFNLFRDYFPVNLIKTADLPAGRNYILVHYPHSIMPFNILPNFLNNSNKLADLFPEIEMKFLTHDITFYVPFVRDYILTLGGCSVSESSFTYLLNSTPSKGIIVVPGGSSEVKYTQPGSIYKIIKSRRKGFVRVALTTGTPLVPVFTFGETNTWNKLLTIPIPGLVKRIANLLVSAPTEVSIGIGRGFFFHFGLLPKKVPVNTIVGAPIEVPKVENPSKELINEYHEKFFQALHDLFEKYKSEYDIAGEKAKLIMV